MKGASPEERLGELDVDEEIGDLFAALACRERGDLM